MNNTKVRFKMIEASMKQWELAKLLGIGESTLSRKLRYELTEDEQKRICELIEQSRSEI